MALTATGSPVEDPCTTSPRMEACDALPFTSTAKPRSPGSVGMTDSGAPQPVGSPTIAASAR
jgi:hypothetical protein